MNEAPFGRHEPAAGRQAGCHVRERSAPESVTRIQYLRVAALLATRFATAAVDLEREASGRENLTASRGDKGKDRVQAAESILIAPIASQPPRGEMTAGSAPATALTPRGNWTIIAGGQSGPVSV